MLRLLAAILLLAWLVILDVLTAAKLWLLIEPVKRLKRRRARRKRLKQLGLEEPMALDTGFRTSTNTVVGTPVVGGVYVALVKLLPYPELVAALTTPEAVLVAVTAIAWGISRFSKTPANPGKL